MSRLFISYIFRLAKRVGALGVLINPDVSYATGALEDVEAARILSEMVKSKAKEFKMLSGAYMPWFRRSDRLKHPDSIKGPQWPKDFQRDFPYEVFYGFDIYLVDARWDNQYEQFGASLGATDFVYNESGEIYETAIDADEVTPKTQSEVANMYKDMLAGDSDEIYWQYQDATVYSLHRRLYNGEVNYEGSSQFDASTPRNYIPVLSVGGVSFFDQSVDRNCVVAGFKTPKFFKDEVNKFFEENKEGVSKIKSFCISSWASIGKHRSSFVGTRWNIVGELFVPDSNLDFSNQSNNNEDPDKYLYLDPNGGNSIIDAIQSGLQKFNDTINPAILLKPDSAPSPESDRNQANPSWANRSDPNKSCPTFNDSSFNTPYNNSCANPASGATNQGSGPQSSSGGGGSGGPGAGGGMPNSSSGGGYGGSSGQNATATPPSNGMEVIDCNPAAAVSSVGGAANAASALGSGGTPPGGGSAGQSTPGVGSAGADPFGINPDGNNPSGLAAAPGSDASDNIFDMSKRGQDYSGLGWSADPGVEMNDSVVDYMNQLSENVYRSLPRSSAAFSSGRSAYTKVRIVSGAMSVEKMIYLMFDKIVAKSSGGRINTMVYDAVYKKSWQQVLKKEVFLSGLNSGHSHTAIRAEAVSRYKQMLAGNQATVDGHVGGKSIDIHTNSVHAALGESNAYNMPPNQMKNTRYVQSLKSAVNSMGNTDICVEDYPQHVHIKTK